MRLALAIFALLLLLAVVAVVAGAGAGHAEERPAAKPGPLTAPQAAEAALEAQGARNDDALRALAAKDDPDPWLVADELVGRGEHDAAAAFAKAAPRTDTARLPEYLAAGRARAPDAAERELLARLTEALASRTPQEVLEATEGLAPSPDTVVRIRLRHLRAQALHKVGKNAEALGLLLEDAATVEALGWLLRAAALTQEAAFRAQDLGDVRRASGLFERTRALHERRGDVKRAATTLSNMGTLHYRSGELDKALPRFEQALTMLEGLGDPGRGWIVTNLAIVQRDLGRLDESLTSFARAIALIEAGGEPPQLPWTFDELAVAHQRRGDLAAAIVAFERARALHESLGNAERVAHTLGLLGSCHEQVGDLPRALAAFERMVANTEQRAAKPALAWALVQGGRVLHAQARYPEALARLERARAVAEEVGDRAFEANALAEIAFAYKSMGRFEPMIEVLERVRAYHEAQGDKANLSATFINLGHAHAGLRQRARAVELYDRGLALAREVGHQQWIVNALDGAARAYMELGDYGRAQANLKQALEQRQALGDEEGVAGAQFLLGCVHAVKADFGKAIATLKEALERQERLGSRAAASLTLNQLGLAYTGLGEYAKALSVHEQSLALKEALGDDVGAAGALINMGIVYGRLGDLVSAAAHYERGLARARKAGHRQWTLNALMNLAVLQLEMGRATEALATWESSLPEIEAEGDPIALVTVLTNIGASYQVLGDHARALAAHERALELGEKAGDRVGLPKTLMNVARAHRGLGHTEKALAFYERSRREASSRRLAPELVRTLTDLAALRLQEGDAAGALRDALAALTEGERLLGGLGDDQGATARAQHQELFIVGALAAVREGDTAELFRFLESGRAGALLDDLDSRDILRWKAEALPEDLLRQDRVAQERERDARAALDRATQGGDREAKREAARVLDEAVEGVRQVGARIQREIKQQAGLFYPRARSIEEVQAALVAGQALVVYGLCGDEALALVLTQEGPRVVPLGATAEVLAACEALDLKRPQGALEGGEAVPALDEVRRLLVAPLGLGETVKQVLVSPEGPLCYLPFGALFDRSVALTPSGTTHALLHEEQSAPGKGVLALGDPDYAGVEGGAAALYHRGRPLVRLPATRVEAQRVGTVSLLGAEASEAQFRKAVARETRWRAVHLACHGLVDPERPFLSSLALSRSEGHDGFLTAREILWTKIPADLAVLSACETATGRLARGEGIVGLTRAFMFAGAPRVICSLWKVDDEATQALMVKFYELWLGSTPGERGVAPGASRGMPVAEALRQAQQHVRSHERWKHPYYWAAWVLWGLPD